MGISGGTFALQPQRLMYGAAEKAIFRSPAAGSPFWGAGVPPRGTICFSSSCGGGGTRGVGMPAGGQAAAARTERSRFLPRPSFPSTRFGIPFPANLRHKWDRSWHLADPSSVPAACRNSHLPACVASFSVYLPSHLNMRDARKQRGKVQAGRLPLAPLPRAPRAPGEVL